jgi:LGFP repeat
MEELAVTILAEGLQVIPGNQVAFKVEVRNLGSVVDRYFCDVLGLDPAWSTVTPASLELLPESGRAAGQAGHGNRPTVGTFTVSLHPPRNPSALARSWPLAVNVRSENDARVHRIEETSVVILPYGLIQAQLTPSASRSRLGTTPMLRLENAGNQTELVSYEGTDTAGRLDFSFTPPKRELKPGQAATVKVRLSPTSSNILGQAQTSSYTIQVRGSGMGTAPIPLSGSHAQVSIIPSQLPWFAAVVIALGMAGLALRSIVAPDPAPVGRASPEVSGGPATPGPSIAPTSGAASPNGHPSAGPSSASATAGPASSAPSPTPTPPPTLTPTLSPTPAPVVADWAIGKANALSDAGHPIGSAVGFTQPTSDGKGQVQRFGDGRVYKTPTGSIWAVRGGINATWIGLGGNPGPVSRLGYPLADETVDGAGHPYQRFQKGVLQCSPGHCSYVVPNAIYTLWGTYGSTIGYPVKDGGSVSGGAAIGTQFDSGIIYHDPGSGFHAVCRLTGQVIHATSPITDCTAYVSAVKAMP